MKLVNREIMNDEDKVVATLTNRNTVKYEPGMAGPYKKRIEALLTELGIVPAADSDEDNKGGDQEKNQGQQSEQAKKSETTVDIAAIPDSALPPFNKVQGVKTPGFGDWIKKHNLNTEQTGALVRRLEKR